jgi:hypothetical protein
MLLKPVIPTVKSIHPSSSGLSAFGLGVFTANRAQLRELHHYGEISVFATLYLNFFSDVYF